MSDNLSDPAAYSPTLGAVRVGIVVARYNRGVTERLLAGSRRLLAQGGLEDSQITVARVPGAWELPCAAARLVASGDYSGIVCLGAVIRGETSHDEHINRAVSQALMQLSVTHAMPIGLGLLTCHTYEQAYARAGGEAGNKGEEAAEAVLEMIGLFQSLSQA